MRLKELSLPENGLALLFYPNGPTDYSAQMLFDPTDLSMEEIKFYMSVGQGLMHMANERMEDVTNLGVSIILARQAEDRLLEQPISDITNVDLNSEPMSYLKAAE